MSPLNWLINKLIKSEFVRSRILAHVRHGATALGVYLVSKGLADNSMVTDLVGFAVTTVSFYLADLDVRIVDGKIKVALATPVQDSTSQEGIESGLANKLNTQPIEIRNLPPAYKKD